MKIKGCDNESVYILKRKLKALLSRIPYYICGLLPIHKNKVVFSAFEGGGYCCNPKYVAEELIRRQEMSEKSYEMIWLVNDINKEFPEEIKKVKNTLWNRAYHLSTARVWVDNARKNYGTRKRNGQFYILTWHGPVGFKPVGRLRGASFSKIAELVSRADARNVDILLSNSEWCSNIWRTAFFGEPIRLTGSPRCDVLFNEREEKRREIRKRFGISDNVRIVMCAPTFRGGSQNKEREVFAETGTIDFEQLKNALEKRFGGEWVVFIRLHPQLALRGFTYGNEKSEKYIDVSRVDDMYELLAAVDVFISDYSSAAFDAAYMKIPVFLYVDDLDEYIADRGKLTWKMEDIPFSIAKNNDELRNNIEKFDENNYLTGLDKTFSEMKLLEDGKASGRVADIIDEYIRH